MSKELDEDVLKIYTSHPDIDLDEIMDRLKFYSYWNNRFEEVKILTYSHHLWNNNIYFSFVNVWEVAIKHAIHKEDVPFTSDEFERFCLEAGFIPLITRFEHAHMISNLKYDTQSAPQNHKDPFDRLLLAQAKVENFLFVTHDQLLPFYNESCIISV